jgi:RNA polymerase sigma-70 factor (ECF subfamily)
MERPELERALERLHPQSFGWALVCAGRDRDLAEDVLQAAYAAILSGKARFEGRASFRTWLFGVIRRTALAELRRSRRLPGEDHAGRAVADAAPGADQALEAAEQRHVLLAALATLSPRQQEVVVLVFYHDLTIEEAASIMEVSLGSARTHYERAKKALLARLSHEVRR